MKYFHWFHGQQTRLHDANNTLHGAAVPFTSRCLAVVRIEQERYSEKEREFDPEIVLRPARLAIVLLTIGQRTLQNVIDRVDYNLDAF